MSRAGRGKYVAGEGSRRWKRRRDWVIERDGFQCVHCHEPGTLESLTVDHIVPRRRGGRNLPENLRSLCLICHLDITEIYVRGIGWISPRGMRILVAESHRHRAPLPISPANSLLLAQFMREVRYKHTSGGERRRA